MKMLEKGNYKVKNWSIKAECTGLHWRQKRKPCHSIYELEDGDIVKRDCDDEFSYGFICEECHCFTEIPEKDIPDEIKTWAPQVAAKGSDAYSNLTDEEKKLSIYL